MKRTKLIVITISTVLLLGVGLTAGLMLGDHKTSTKAATKNTASASQSTDAIDARLNKAQIYKIGETVPYASEKAIINSVSVATTLTSQYGQPVFADTGTKFVIVNMTLTNTTLSEFMYNPFVLVDQKDRVYNNYENTIGSIDNYLESKQLSPDVPLTGNDVYQVPNDTTEVRIGGLVGNTDTLRYVKVALATN